MPLDPLRDYSTMATVADNHVIWILLMITFIVFNFLLHINAVSVIWWRCMVQSWEIMMVNVIQLMSADVSHLSSLSIYLANEEDFRIDS